MKTVKLLGKSIFLCVFLIPPIEINAQQIIRSNINSYGTNSISNDGITITQSVGQSALTNSAKTENIYYRNGFQQNNTSQSNQHELFLEMYPNPNQGDFSIILNSQEALEISIFDQQGKLITYERRNGNLVHEFKFNHLAAGMYQLHIKSAGKSTTSKLIIYK
jgi:hypothetical protein